MADESIGRPIPKIVGRGKNRLKRPYTAHSYDLRSTITRCQSSEDANCSFCTFYKTSHKDLLDYNGKLRTQLLKTTTRALIIDRWSRQKDGKIKKLRGLLQERADALRDKNIEMQECLREARLRREELKNTVTQLQQSRDEVANLNSQLEHAGKRVKTLEETCEQEKQKGRTIKSKLKSLIENLSPLLTDLKGVVDIGDEASDSESISAKLDSLQETLTLCQAEISIGYDRSEEPNVCNSHELIRKMIAEVICGVCHDMFIDPVALPCGHVFCEFCIRMWFKRCRGCPVCRRKVLTCSQLHAIYQFREIVGMLNSYRETDEQNTRAQEMLKRSALKDELYSDPAPRRVRERSVNPNDRGERFTHRRRRLDGTTSIPYPIPLPDSNLPTARLDILPPPRDIHPPMALTPHQIPNPFTRNGEPDPSTLLGHESPRNMMSLLLNETFSSIDRFIRGPTFPMIRPLDMIEAPGRGHSTVEEVTTAPDTDSAADVPTTSGWSSGSNMQTVSAQADSSTIGTSDNPILISDSVSEERMSRRTPTGTPPQARSESSEEIWPNETVAIASQYTSTHSIPLLEERRTQASIEPDLDLVSLSESDTQEVLIEINPSTSVVGDLQNIMDGELLSDSSRSDITYSDTVTDAGTESETESEDEDSEAEEGRMVEQNTSIATGSLEDID